MSLLALRNAIIAALAQKLPALPVQGHPAGFKVAVSALGGRLDAEELKRILTTLPAVKVACLDVGVAEIQGDEVACTASWGAFVLAKDEPGCPKDAAALTVVAELLRTIPGCDWSAAADSEPTGLRAENLFGSSLTVALWAVTWRQKVSLKAVSPDQLRDFLLFTDKFDLAPVDGVIAAEDQVKLPR